MLHFLFDCGLCVCACLFCFCAEIVCLLVLCLCGENTPWSSRCLKVICPFVELLTSSKSFFFCSWDLASFFRNPSWMFSFCSAAVHLGYEALQIFQKGNKKSVGDSPVTDNPSFKTASSETFPFVFPCILYPLPNTTPVLKQLFWNLSLHISIWINPPPPPPLLSPLVLKSFPSYFCVKRYPEQVPLLF